MATRDITPFQKAVDAIEALPLEDQHSALELIHRRLVEARRLEIAERMQGSPLQAINEGGANYGSVEDLKRDLKGKSCGSSLGTEEKACGSLRKTLTPETLLLLLVLTPYCLLAIAYCYYPL